ncbi:MAG TPA: serine/threonine-protein kinase, partial [Amaricoccus sp.]|nr:serine/threonine-protein kinase [Amaricoccus sp.]
ASDEAARRLVQREEKISRALRHKNIVRTLSGGVVSDGRAYLVYEFIEGFSLADVLGEMAPFTPVHTVSFLRPLLDALRAMHAVGIIHRDIKPSNILVSRERGAVLLDLGAAGLLSARNVTEFGEIAGSPLWMSPEQINGTPQGPAADLYGLALVALEMDTGHPPPGGSNLLELFRERTMRAPNISDASSELLPFLEACLRPVPMDRPASVDEAVRFLPTLGREPWWEVVEAPRRSVQGTRWIFDEETPANCNQDSEAKSVWIFDDPIDIERSIQNIRRDGDVYPEGFNSRTFFGKRRALHLSVALNVVFFGLMLITAFLWLSSSRNPVRQSVSSSHEGRAGIVASVDAGTILSIGLIAGGFVICALGLWLVRLFYARTGDVRVQLRHAATEAINDPDGADWLSRTIFEQIEEYQRIARTTGDRALTISLILVARNMFGANNLEDQHNAMRMFIDLHEKLSARLTPWWLSYEKLVGRALSGLSLATGALAMFQGLRGLL